MRGGSEARTRIILRAAFAGVASACLSTLWGFTQVDVREQDVTVWFLDNRFLFFGPMSLPAGLFFGLALSWMVGAQRRASPWTSLWLVSCSVLAWYVAVFYIVPLSVQALDEAVWLPDLAKRILFGMPSGAVGALCVAGATAVPLKPLLAFGPVSAVTATGAVTGSAAGLLGDPPLSFFPLFLTWQVGVLVVIVAVVTARSSMASLAGASSPRAAAPPG